MARGNEPVTIGNSQLFSLKLGQIRALLENLQNTAERIRFSGSHGYENTEGEPVFNAITNPKLVFAKLERLEMVHMDRVGIKNSNWLVKVRTIIEKSPVLKELVLHCQHDFNEDLTKNDGILCILPASIEKLHFNSVATGETFKLLTPKSNKLKNLDVRCWLFSSDYEAIQEFFRKAFGLEELILKEGPELDTGAQGDRKRSWMSMNMGTETNRQPSQLMQLLAKCVWQPHPLPTRALENGHYADATHCVHISQNFPALQVVKISVRSSVRAADVAMVAHNLSHLRAFELSLDCMESFIGLSEIVEQFILWSCLRDTKQLGKTFAITMQRSRCPYLFSWSTVTGDTTPEPVEEFSMELNVCSVGSGERKRYFMDAKTNIEWNKLLILNGRILLRYGHFSTDIGAGLTIFPWFFKTNPVGNGKGVSLQPKYSPQALRVQLKKPEIGTDLTICE